jgi:multiple sugar transport system permease protein
MAAAAPPYLYLAPALLLLAVWVYRPLVSTADLSFSTWDLLPTTPKVPAGASNYRQVLSLPQLWHAARVTALFALGMLPFGVVLPTVTALAARRVRGRAATVYRALVFAPFLVSPVASAALWQWLLAPKFGAVDRLLGTDLNWLNESGPAQLSIIVITGWSFLGFAVLIVNAAVAQINDEYTAAAQLDGASGAQIVRRITLPLLSPTLVFLTLMSLLLSAQLSFPLIDALTQGGPADATTSIYYLLYEYAFRTFQAGLGAAAGLLFFVAFTVLALFLVWLAEKLTFHDN